MDNEILSKEILKKLNFLITDYSYSVCNNKPHWLGGLLIEFKKDDFIISILYDKREGWFLAKLNSFSDENKTHLYLVEELRNLCSSLPNPTVSLDDEINTLFFLTAFSECLKKNLLTVIENFKMGNYYGG